MTDDEIAKLVDDKIAEALDKLASTEGAAMLQLLEMKPGPRILNAIVARSGDWLRFYSQTSDDPALRAQAAASVARGEAELARLKRRASEIAAKKGRR